MRGVSRSKRAPRALGGQPRSFRAEHERSARFARNDKAPLGMTSLACASHEPPSFLRPVPVPNPGNPISLHLGIDLGGTAVKLGVSDDAGTPLARATIATDAPRGSDDTIGRIARAAREL